jgi:GNAT superfamily N-acetyltransferase
MLLSDLQFSQLSPNTQISSFDCGDKDLNDFFQNVALLYKQELLAVTYCFEDYTGKVIGFFSVSNDSLIDKDFEKWNSLSRKISNQKRRKDYPAVKIGRLGVHKDYAGKNLGGQILAFIKAWFAFNNKTGCRFLLVDAYNRPEVIRFYEKNDFATVTMKDELKKTRLMYFDLMKITDVGVVS